MTLLGTLSAPPTRILVVGDAVYASAYDRAAAENPRAGEVGNGGVFRFRDGGVERISAWPHARLAAVDDDFVWYWAGSLRRTPVHGGDEYRVAMNIWDIAFDRELAYLLAQGCVFAIPRRGPLIGSDAETTDVLHADVAQVEVDDAYIVTIENEPEDRPGFRVVKRPKKGGAPVEIARESRSARTFGLRDGIAVVAQKGGPMLVLSVDGDAREEVRGTEGVEHFVVDGPFLYWPSPEATSRPVLHRRSLYEAGAPAERLCELPIGSSPSLVFDVAGGMVAWRESLSTPHRDETHRIHGLRLNPQPPESR